MTSRVCAIAGGSGAGKTTLANKLLEELTGHATHITIDWYYRDLGHLSAAERDAVNFDHPDSLEVDLFVRHLDQLRNGTSIDAPVYDFATHTRTAETRLVQAEPLVITEGIHLLGLAEVREICDVLVFIDVAADVRLARRMQRDVRERGRTEQSVKLQWDRTVAPMHDQFVEPSKQFATIIVGELDDLNDAASQIATHLRDG